MPWNAQTTLGQLAAENPLYARVLERHQLDYCARSQTPLDNACQERGVPVEEVVNELLRWSTVEASGQDWSEAPLEALTDHIEQRYHGSLRQDLPVLEARMKKVCQAHGRTNEELYHLSEVLSNLAEELREHMMKEERILFPWIRALARGQENSRDIHRPIAVMEHEHHYANQLLQVLRQSTHDYTPPEGACGTFRALYAGLEALEKDLHSHISLENDLLFPRVLALARGSAG